MIRKKTLFHRTTLSVGLIGTIAIGLGGCAGEGCDNPYIVEAGTFDTEGVGYLHNDIYEGGFKEMLSEENPHTTEPAARVETCNSINMIFDVSSGLKEGFVAAEYDVIIPVYHAFSTRTLYQCAFEKDNTCGETVVDSEASPFDEFRKQSTYKSFVSYIKGGIERATKNPDELSVLFTDYLYDDGSPVHAATDLNGNPHEDVKNILEEGIATDDFAKWFANGGRVYIQVIPYDHPSWGIETNYYAIYFVPRYCEFESKQDIKQIFEDIPPLVFDPLNVSVDSEALKNDYVGSSVIYNGDDKIVDFPEGKRYCAIALKYGESKDNELDVLGSLMEVNNSPWEIDYSMEPSNISSQLNDTLFRCDDQVRLGWNEDDQGHNFVSWDYQTGEVVFNNEGKGGFNPVPYQERPDIFGWKNELNISSMKPRPIEEGELTCKVRPDHKTSFFMNKALYHDIRGGLRNSKVKVQELLQEKPIYCLYTFTSVGKY